VDSSLSAPTVGLVPPFLESIASSRSWICSVLSPNGGMTFRSHSRLQSHCPCACGDWKLISSRNMSRPALPCLHLIPPNQARRLALVLSSHKDFNLFHLLLISPYKLLICFISQHRCFFKAIKVSREHKHCLNVAQAFCLHFKHKDSDWTNQNLKKLLDFFLFKTIKKLNHKVNNHRKQRSI